MDVVLISLVSAFLIEQVFCLFLGSYPYRYGFPISKINLPVNSAKSWGNVQKRCRNLKLRINEQRKEVYCRYSYQLGSGTTGPFLFTGQIKFSSPEIVLIRMGPCSGLLAVYLTAESIIGAANSGEVFKLLDAFAVFVPVLFFYFLLSRSLKQITSDNSAT